MSNTEILEHLSEIKTQYHQITQFSNKPGIYAIYFHGEAFPDSKLNIKKDDLIYIGKTESSQTARERDTHFKAGKTGSSTLRRTIGSLLREELELFPIPRNKSDFQKGRTTFFTFIEPSEGKLSSWMKANLSLSFYEYPKSPAAIDFLETELIKIALPVFNISKYSSNPMGPYLKEQRKACGELAFSQSKLDPSKGTVQSQGEKSHVYIPTRSEGGFSPRSFVEHRDEKPNTENKYTLHEAMEMILKELPNRTASFDFISQEIWKKGLYKQKSGGIAHSDQIKLRALNYSQFEIEAGYVKLIN